MNETTWGRNRGIKATTTWREITWSTTIIVALLLTVWWLAF